MRSNPIGKYLWFCILCFCLSAPLPSFANDASPGVTPVPLHGDWFKIQYDDIKNLSVVSSKTDDPFGPGNPERSTDGDGIKIDLMAGMEGKVFYGNSFFQAFLTVSRMAGVGDEDNYKPFNNQGLFLFSDVTQVYFLLPSGERILISDDDLSVSKQKSTGLIGDHYIWERMKITLDWDQLNQLRNGAKIAIGTVEFELHRDSISQIQSVIMIIEDQAPKDK